MLNKNLKEILDGNIELPTLPDVIMRLLSAVDNPESTAPDIARIIGSDQSLMAKILKLVNSPFYGMPRQISTLTQATVVMGFTAIRNIALTIAVFDEFELGAAVPEKFGYTREKLWEHSIATAITANVIAHKINYAKKEDAFIAGLIHDIGKVVFDRFCHEDFVTALTLADASGRSLFDAEVDIFGESHAFIGSWVTEKWQLPSHLVDSIRYHHTPDKGEVELKLVEIVHAANNLVHAEGYGNGGDDIVPEINGLFQKTFGFSQHDLHELKLEVKQNFESAVEFFQTVA
ncbi:HDOD domain-containing protein [candidate division KSB1 bacterium]|nr:HDOD domain-containing protein [candidate division KSB1 bacterium]